MFKHIIKEQREFLWRRGVFFSLLAPARAQSRSAPSHNAPPLSHNAPPPFPRRSAPTLHFLITSSFNLSARRFLFSKLFLSSTEVSLATTQKQRTFKMED